MNKNKNGIDYHYIAFKLVSNYPENTLKDFDNLLERMEDFDLLSKEGMKIRQIFHGACWNDEYFTEEF